MDIGIVPEETDLIAFPPPVSDGVGGAMGAADMEQDRFHFILIVAGCGRITIIEILDALMSQKRQNPLDILELSYYYLLRTTNRPSLQKRD